MPNHPSRTRGPGVPAGVPRRTRPPALLALLALAMLLGLLGAAPAAAHDQLVESDPAAGSTLSAPPSVVVLRFSADLLDLSATILLTGPQGPVAVGEPLVEGAVVTAALPPDLGDGEYTVTWRVVSADGHPIQDTFGFTVAAPVAAPSSASPSSAAPSNTPTSGTPTADPTPSPSATPDAATDAGADRAPLVAAAVAVLLALVTAAVVVLERRPRPSDPTSGEPR